jgi:hypothetical protein
MPNPEIPQPELSKEDQLKTRLRAVLKDYQPVLEHDFLYAARGFGRIFGEIGTKIRDNYYTSVVGDDVSGRIPALIMYRTLEKIHGEQKPNMLFLQGGRASGRERWQKVAEHIRENKDRFGEHPLVVSEFAKGGGTAIRFDIAFDEAAGVKPEHAILVKGDLYEDLGPNVHFGFVQHEIGYSWAPFETVDKMFTGVERSEDGALSKGAGLYATKPIREAVDITADYLAAELMSEEK